MSTAKPVEASSDPSPPPPRHIGIIMDGNGRWAAQRNLPRRFGHRQGVETMRKVTEEASDLGIEYLTLYGFSSENWSRPAEEVSDLMGLLKHFVRQDLETLVQKGVNVRVIGERAGLDPEIAGLIDEAEARTAGNARLNLVIAFNYGGQDEIVAAAQALARAAAEGRIAADDITKDVFRRHLHTAGIPDPDLVIRTSGEQRISNFLIWQSAYAELVFIDTFWPDFTRAHLLRAIAEYHRRERRFGARLTQALS